MGWFELAVDPLMTAAMIAQPLALRSRLKWLKDQLNMWLVSADERQAAGMLLSFLGLSLIEEPQQHIEPVNEKLRVIDDVPLGEQAKIMQSYARIALAGMFCKEDQFNISPERMRQLLQQIPSGHGNLEIWFGAAQWAFHNRQMDVLEQALEFCVMGYPGSVDEQVWRTCNLMFRLRSQRAITQDITSLINCCEHPVQISQFRDELLADCDIAGLINPEMLYWIDRRERELLRRNLSLADRVQTMG